MILRCGGLYATVAYSYDEEGNQIPRLSLDKKAKILAHNIYGVDLDPQAVEVTMISLYIKILEGEAPVGMVTERDIGRRIVAKKMPYDIKVSEIMTKKLVTVEPDVSLKDAARLMSTNKIRRLPVVKQKQAIRDSGCFGFCAKPRQENGY